MGVGPARDLMAGRIKTAQAGIVMLNLAPPYIGPAASYQDSCGSCLKTRCTTLVCAGEPGIDPLSNNPPLELSKYTQHLKHGFASGR